MIITVISECIDHVRVDVALLCILWTVIFLFY